MKNTRVRMSPVSYPNLGPGVIPANADNGPRCHTQTPQVIGPRCHTHLLNLNLIGGRYPQDRPRHRHGCVDNQQHPSAGDAARSLPGFAARVTDAFRRVVPCPETSERIPAPLIGFASTSGYRNRSRSPLKSFVIKAIRNYFAGTSVSRQCQSSPMSLAEGIYARVAASPLTLSERKTRARGASWRSVRSLRNTRDCRPRRGGGGAGGANLLDRPIIDISMRFRGPLSKKLGGVAPEKSGFQRGGAVLILAAPFSRNSGRP
jgi:hypothetical protein